MRLEPLRTLWERAVTAQERRGASPTSTRRDAQVALSTPSPRLQGLLNTLTTRARSVSPCRTATRTHDTRSPKPRPGLRLFDTTRFNAGATLTHGYASNTRDGRPISSEKP